VVEERFYLVQKQPFNNYEIRAPEITVVYSFFKRLFILGKCFSSAFALVWPPSPPKTDTNVANNLESIETA